MVPALHMAIFGCQFVRFLGGETHQFFGLPAVSFGGCILGMVHAKGESFKKKHGSPTDSGTLLETNIAPKNGWLEY